MKRIRVFHVVSSLDLGGAERVAINIAKSQTAEFEYHLFEVFHSRSEFAEGIRRELKRENIQFHGSPFGSGKVGIVFFWLWFSWHYARLRPSIIHSHTEIPDLALWLFRKVAWLFFWVSVHYVRTIHNTELWNEWKGIGRLVEPYYIKHGCNVAISESVRECYQKSYGTIPPILVANGIPESQQRPFGQLGDGVNVLFAGRLEPQKGVDVMIDVFKRLAQTGRFSLHIIGNGSMKAHVQRELEGLPNIQMHDAVYGLSSYLASFDYVFMPSEHEGLALMPIEASFARTPVIINRCQGLVETLPPDWPLAVDGNRVEDFLSLFENIESYDNADLCDRAYRYAKEHFGVTKMQTAYEQVYREKRNNECNFTPPPHIPTSGK